MKKGYDYNKLLLESKDIEQRIFNLQDIHRILNNLCIDHWLYEGALLGIYRDGNFISWDWDVDLLVFTEKIMPVINILKEALVDAGFVIKITKKKKRLKINTLRSGERLSINGYHLNKKKNLRVRVPYRFPCFMFNPGDFIEFKGELYRCPGPIEAYLEMAYGDWRTPIKSGNPDEYRRGRGENSISVEEKYHSNSHNYRFVNIDNYQGYKEVEGD